MKFPTFALSICTLAVGWVALGQELPQTQPQSEHQWLEQFAGEWITHSELTMGPDQPPIKCEGTMNSRMVGGFWIVNEMKGDVMGTPVAGIQTIGYDTEKKKYVGTWIDSSNGFLWKYEAVVDESGKKMILDADGPNFMAPGTMAKFRDTYEFKSKDEIIGQSLMLGEDGKWVDFMTARMTRKK